MATERVNKEVLTAVLNLINGTLKNNFGQLSATDSAINDNIARLQSILADVNASVNTLGTGVTAIGEEVETLKENMQNLELADSVTEDGDSAVKSSGIYSFVKEEANTIQTAVDEEVSRLDEALTQVGTQLEGLKPDLTVTETGEKAVASSGVYTFVKALLDEAVSNIIDNAVKVLSSTETYTDENYPTAQAVIDYVASAISTLTRVKIEVVNSLPEIADAEVNTFYFVPAANATGSNYFDEYIFIVAKGDIPSHFELVGSTQIDLSNYVTIEKLNETVEALKTELEEKLDALSEKIDTIEETETSHYNSITTTITNIQTKVETLEGDNTSIQEKLDALDKIVNGDEESNTPSLADRVTALEEGGTGGGTIPDDLSERIETIETNVSNLQTSVTTLATGVDEAKTDAASASTAATAAQTAATAAQTAASSAETKAEAASTAATAAKTKADTNATNITSLTSRVKALEDNDEEIEAMTAEEIQAIYDSVFGSGE